MSGFLGDDDLVLCKVVINHESQYSIWPDQREAPLGWVEEGYRGTRRDCLNYIEGVWLDMTPQSLLTRDSSKCLQ